MEKITSKEFVYTLCEIWNEADRRICFVLGAGASKSSGIRTGAELAALWLGEIQKRMSEEEGRFEKFVEEKNINTEYPGANYPELYRERYRFDRGTGFDFISNEMERANPGYGYSVLAQMMAEKQHNIVITTNFDNLTEEALYTYTSKRPVICGHESLASFAKPSLKRPLIVKIHRDRYFNPQSEPTEIAQINKLWINALNTIFSLSTPVFIGYGGNDGSLMGYMESITSINNLFWCERKGSQVSERVENLLEKNDGKLVEIEGFDEIMFLLQDGLKLKLLDKNIVEIAQARAKVYQDTVVKIRNEQAKSLDKDVQKAAERIVEKANENDWLSWELKAGAAKTTDEKENIYKEGLGRLPNSPELNGNYAYFLKDIHKNYNEAEKYYTKALDIDPDNEINNASYAIFLKDKRKNYDEAEKYYKKTLEINPESAINNGNYANFLKDIRKNYDEAEKYYKRALEVDPNNAINNGNYAIFLSVIRKNYDEAEKYYKGALEIDPNDAINNGNYANFLKDIRKNYDEAEKYYKRALEIDPNNAINNGNYAIFLKDIRKNYDEAEKYYKKALEIDPENAINNCDYAIFLSDIRKNYDEAEIYYKKALEIDPGSAINNGIYANFLHSIRKNYDEAEIYYKKALEIDPENANNNGNYGIFLHVIRKNYDEAEKYYKKTLEVDPGNTNINGNYAGILFSTGNNSEVLNYLNKAFENCDDADLATELWFYKYAHVENDRENSLKQLHHLICDEKARSIDFNLQNNVDYAIKKGIRIHNYYKKLRIL